MLGEYIGVGGKTTYRLFNNFVVNRAFFPQSSSSLKLNSPGLSYFLVQNSSSVTRAILDQKGRVLLQEEKGAKLGPVPVPPKAASNEKKLQLLSQQTVLKTRREVQSAARVQVKSSARLGVD